MCNEPPATWTREHQAGGNHPASKITALPVWHHRDRASYLARLGAAHAADKMPDAAALAGMGALTEARRASSRHVLAELWRLDTTLIRRWPEQQNVRQFHEALLATRLGGGITSAPRVADRS